MLHRDARALLDLITERGLPAMHTLTPVEARAFYRDRRGFTQPPAPEVGSVLDTRCDGPHGAIALRIYRPIGAGPAPTKGSAPLPALVYYHGGGWTIGDLDTHDVLCRELCNGSGAVVVAVDYRMGPEHRFPAAVDDCLAATTGCVGKPTSSASTPGGSRSAATAPAATSPPSSRSSRAMPATCRSRTSC